MINTPCKDQLHNENQRHADDKGFVFGFMPEYIHAEQGTNRTADCGDQKQLCLWNAPAALDGTAFVNSHLHESDEIDNQKIDSQNQKKWMRKGNKP